MTDFIAKAERGYHFDRWTVNETADTESGDTLTVDCRDGQLTVDSREVLTGEVIDA